MKDILAEFIQDYNDGIISLSDLERRLEFNTWSEDKAQHPLPTDYVKHPIDPIDIVLEKERMRDIGKALRYLRSVLTDKEWETIVLISKGRTQEEIAAKYGVTQGIISRRLARIKVKAEKTDLKKLLFPEPCMFFAEKAQVKIAYPMDREMNKVVDGKVKCMMPEYLDEIFHCDKKVLCCYCDREKCKRKSSNKEGQ